MENLQMGTSSPSNIPAKRPRTIMLAVLDEHEPLDAALRTATRGLVLPSDDPDQLATALQGILHGTGLNSANAKRVIVCIQEETHGPEREKVALSPREKDVLKALVEGMSYKMIAHSLSISFETVRSHIKRIYEKLRVHNNTEAVARTIREGLLT